MRGRAQLMRGSSKSAGCTGDSHLTDHHIMVQSNWRETPTEEANAECGEGSNDVQNAGKEPANANCERVHGGRRTPFSANSDQRGS
jgi:hypothetical protein